MNCAVNRCKLAISWWIVYYILIYWLSQCVFVCAKIYSRIAQSTSIGNDEWNWLSSISIKWIRSQRLLFLEGSFYRRRTHHAKHTHTQTLTPTSLHTFDASVNKGNSAAAIYLGLRQFHPRFSQYCCHWSWCAVCNTYLCMCWCAGSCVMLFHFHYFDVMLLESTTWILCVIVFAADGFAVMAYGPNQSRKWNTQIRTQLAMTIAE